jgi:hypothetical protein
MLGLTDFQVQALSSTAETYADYAKQDPQIAAQARDKLASLMDGLKLSEAAKAAVFGNVASGAEIASGF